jgi:hypothetical protein
MAGGPQSNRWAHHGEGARRAERYWSTRAGGDTGNPAEARLAEPARDPIGEGAAAGETPRQIRIDPSVADSVPREDGPHIRVDLASPSSLAEVDEGQPALGEARRASNR